MFGLYVFICLVVSVFVFLDTHTHGDGVGVTFIELLISFPWANMLVIYSIIGFILTGCEEFINHIKEKNNEKENL